MNYTAEHFEEIESKNDCSILLDEERCIIAVRWTGKVDAETAGYIMANVLAEIKAGNANAIFFDLVKLDEFSFAARSWLKDDFLINKLKPENDLIRKIAYIKPATSMGGIYSNLFISAIKIVIPFTSVSGFEKLEQATRWLVKDTTKEFY